MHRGKNCPPEDCSRPARVLTRSKKGQEDKLLYTIIDRIVGCYPGLSRLIGESKSGLKTFAIRVENSTIIGKIDNLPNYNVFAEDIELCAHIAIKIRLQGGSFLMKPPRNRLATRR